MRDHQPIQIDQFNGLWARGDFDSCPVDHWTDCANMIFSQGSALSRNFFTKDVPGAIQMVRQKIFITNVSGTQTVFLMSLGTNSNLYQQQIFPILAGAPTSLGAIPNSPIDFDLVNFNGRAYITFSMATVGIVGTSVYYFDGTNFGLAGGTRPTIGSWNIVTGAHGSGNINAVNHAFAVSFETANGFLSSVLFFTALVQFSGDQQAVMTNLPVGPAGTVARRIFMSKATTETIPPNQNKIFFVLRVADNTTTSVNVNAYDSQLLEDDTYLYTVLDSLPSGVGIGKYHNRLVLWGFPTQTITIRVIGGGPNITLNLTPSTVIFSNINDPETIDTLNNLAILDGNSTGSIPDWQGNSLPIGVTACQEYRDLCYVFKLTRTFALTDNQDVPATWNVTTVDEGTGAFVRGVSTVLDSGGVNYEYLLISNITGIYTFNGLFVRPELTYKIADLWKIIAKSQANSTQPLAGKYNTILDTVNKQIYILTAISPNSIPSIMLVCDYANSFIGDPNFSQACRWSKWTFDLNNTFKPVTLTGWDNGIVMILYTNDSLSGATWIYNGTNAVKEVLLNPFFQTYMICSDQSDFVHLGAIRYRVNGNTNGAIPVSLNTQVINEDLTRSSQLAGINIIQAMGKEPMLLANWMSQKFMINVGVGNNNYFDINKMIPFVQAIYTSGPQ